MNLLAESSEEDPVEDVVPDHSESEVSCDNTWAVIKMLTVVKTV